MKSTKTFNNISDKLKATIPVLKPGEVAVFQMLNGVPNPEPDEKERSRSPILYGKRQIQTNFRIYDPFQTDEKGVEVGGYVDVGCVDSWNKDEPLNFRFFLPGMGQTSQFQGKFQLAAGNIKDMELYEVLWLSNEREGNPHRDKTAEPLFKILDSKADSQKTITRVSILKKALEIAEKLKSDPVKSREVMAALNKSYQDTFVMEAEIANLASSKPEELIKVYESKDTPLKALVREAMDSGVISQDFNTGKVKIGDVEIHTLKAATQDSFITEFSAWINTSENGKDVLGNIKSKMKKEEIVGEETK